MRRAAMLVLFALLAVAMVFAQNPANANSNPPANTQQNNGTNTTFPNATTPNQNAPTGSATGETNQNNPSTPEQNTQPAYNQNTNQNTQNIPNNQNTNQSTNPNNQGMNPSGTNNQNAMPSYNQSNSNSNPTFGNHPPAPANGSDQVAAGTEIHATLDTPLSTKTSKPGDRFTATITQPVPGSNGGVVIPAGSRVEGEVTESEEGKAVAALRGRGKLNVRFRDIVLPNGQSLPVAATLVSVNSTNGKDSKNANQEGQVESSTRGRDVAKDVGIGAGIGTVAGLLFGGPLKGLAIGALAGGGYVLATKGKEVNLPAQTGMVLRLDQAVSNSSPSANMRR
jgi:hypothetical protein